MSAGELQLLRLDVDAGQADARELLPEHGQDGADAATDLEQARPRLELRAVADQPVPPVLRLLDEALLLGRAVTVDVVGQSMSSTRSRSSSQESASLNPSSSSPPGSSSWRARKVSSSSSAAIASAAATVAANSSGSLFASAARSIRSR